MKKFIVKILSFCIVIYILAIPVDYFLTKGLHHSNERMFAIWNDIYNENNLNNDLVILGASTAWTSYSTPIMDSIFKMNTYVLGIDGHPWYMYKIRYNTYRKHSRAPKYMVINLDVLTFQNGLLEPYEREQFLPYIHNDNELYREIREDKKISLADYIIPTYRYWGYYDLKDIAIDYYRKHKLYSHGPQKGYLPNHTSPWDRASLDRDSVHVIPYSQCVYDDIVSFISQAKSEGIKVVLCRYPIYYELRDIEENMDEMVDVYSRLSVETNSPLFDFSDISLVYDSTFFYNPTHLNIHGSIPYTNMFCEQFLQLNY